MLGLQSIHVSNRAPESLVNADGWICHEPWWRHQMETFSALLAICAGNSPVTGEFPAQRPVTRSFGVFFDLRLNKRLSKQSWGWCVKMLSPPLWRHNNGSQVAKWIGQTLAQHWHIHPDVESTLIRLTLLSWIPKLQHIVNMLVGHIVYRDSLYLNTTGKGMQIVKYLESVSEWLRTSASL